MVLSEYKHPRWASLIDRTPRRHFRLSDVVAQVGQHFKSELPGFVLEPNRSWIKGGADLPGWLLYKDRNFSGKPEQELLLHIVVQAT